MSPVGHRGDDGLLFFREVSFDFADVVYDLKHYLLPLLPTHISYSIYAKKGSLVGLK
jgi:hypothetical protein